jgi:hypothetical protein
LSTAGEQTRYVAFFDILGFKAAVEHNLDEAWGALEDVRVSVEETLTLFRRTPHDTIILPNSVRTTATNFSDSILIFTQHDEPQDLHSILVSSAALFAKSLTRCVPLRGGISYGKFYLNFDKNLFCGMPLITASRIAESAQWSGVVVDDLVAGRHQVSPLTSAGEPVIINWSVPTKQSGGTGKEDHQLLNWPLIYKRNFNAEFPISGKLWSKPFERLFGGSYQNWPKDVQAKYDNTVELVNAILREEPV